MAGELPGERAAMEKNAAGRSVREAHELLKEFVSANPNLEGAQSALEQSIQRINSMRAGITVEQLKEMSQATMSSLEALQKQAGQENAPMPEKPVDNPDIASEIRVIHSQIAQLAAENPDLKKAQDLLAASNDRLNKLQGELSVDDLTYMKNVAENALNGLRITISMRKEREKI